jgi:NAD(P)-dependent dehydrogenase (short-subunit alcohol dehydrogenase family)
MSLLGRSVLVVGAGTRDAEPDAPVGNGRAIAVRAARDGATVACLDVNPDAAAKTVDLITEAGGSSFPVVADVSDAVSVDRAVAEVAARTGPLHGLVLNVGMAAGMGLDGTSPDTWDQVFAVNVRSHFLVVRALAPHLADGGSVVFASSVAAARPFSGIPAYDSSKGAVEALMRHTMVELAPRAIRVNAVRIGVMDTPIGRDASRNRPGRDAMALPLGRKGSAWEVASVVAFFLSDDASYVSGQTLAVDGGLTSQA